MHILPHFSHGELHVCTCHVQICEELKQEPCDAKGEGWGDSVDPVLWVLPGTGAESGPQSRTNWKRCWESRNRQVGTHWPVSLVYVLR